MFTKSLKIPPIISARNVTKAFRARQKIFNQNSTSTGARTTFLTPFLFLFFSFRIADLRPDSALYAVNRLSTHAMRLLLPPSTCYSICSVHIVLELPGFRKHTHTHAII